MAYKIALSYHESIKLYLLYLSIIFIIFFGLVELTQTWVIGSPIVSKRCQRCDGSAHSTLCRDYKLKLLTLLLLLYYGHAIAEELNECDYG